MIKRSLIAGVACAALCGPAWAGQRGPAAGGGATGATLAISNTSIPIGSASGTVLGTLSVTGLTSPTDTVTAGPCANSGSNVSINQTLYASFTCNFRAAVANIGAVEKTISFSVTGSLPTPTYLPSGLSQSYAWVYSTHKLVSSYTGAMGTVERTGSGCDSATMDVPFSAINEPDLSNVLTWAGACNLQITQIYDQTGNYAPVAQATASLQPYLFTANTIRGFQPITFGFTPVSPGGGAATSLILPTAISLSRQSVSRYMVASNVGVFSYSANNNTAQAFGTLGTDATFSNDLEMLRSVNNTAQPYASQFGLGALGAASYVYGPAAPNVEAAVLGLTSSPSGWTMRANGVEVTSATPFSAQTLTGGSIGGGVYASAATPAMDWFADVGFAGPLSTSDKNALDATLGQIFDAQISPTRNLVWDGDSLTAGYQVGTLLYGGLARQVAPALNKRWRMYDIAIGGNLLANLYASRQAAYTKYSAQMQRNVLNIFAGTNDFAYIPVRDINGTVVAARPTASTTSGSNSVTLSSATGVSIGNRIYIPGAVNTAYISALSGTTATLSSLPSGGTAVNATATVSNAASQVFQIVSCTITTGSAVLTGCNTTAGINAGDYLTAPYIPVPSNLETTPSAAVTVLSTTAATITMSAPAANGAASGAAVYVTPTDPNTANAFADSIYNSYLAPYVAAAKSAGFDTVFVDTLFIRGSTVAGGATGGTTSIALEGQLQFALNRLKYNQDILNGASAGGYIAVDIGNVPAALQLSCYGDGTHPLNPCWAQIAPTLAAAINATN